MLSNTPGQTEKGGGKGHLNMAVPGRSLGKDQLPPSPRPIHRARWISGSQSLGLSYELSDLWGRLHEPENVLSDENCLI